MSIPRQHYQSVNGGKRVAPNRMTQQIMSPLPQHDDIIKFVFDSWSKVNREFSEQNFSEAGHNPSVTYYEEREPNPLLKDFEPFDLEAWWAKRLVQNIQAASSSSS
ncbi:hypothetical protein RUM43_001920 [Polyplax serrata]|uniref:MAPK regulated corepressor interacting protein 2 n=1 Tax=Polyplax serrata TaxID=468196 RepID=A0AAN8XRK8_POLSC